VNIIRVGSIVVGKKPIFGDLIGRTGIVIRFFDHLRRQSSRQSDVARWKIHWFEAEVSKYNDGSRFAWPENYFEVIVP